jgi:hypothetical protein
MAAADERHDADLPAVASLASLMLVHDDGEA